jgi:hypothetical protein
MVKDNIPIENKKPFETVQELKDKYEIPSWEEFAKNYESNGNLNYDDLSNGDIGTQKGYGPCSYANKDCTHYIGSGYAPLYMSCPYCSNQTRSVWTHSGNSCYGPMYISEYLRLECKRCYTGGHWREWQFSCSEHRGYQYASSFSSFNDALRLGLAIQYGNLELRDLVKRISKKLIDES